MTSLLSAAGGSSAAVDVRRRSDPDSAAVSFPVDAEKHVTEKLHEKEKKVRVAHKFRNDE